MMARLAPFLPTTWEKTDPGMDTFLILREGGRGEGGTETGREREGGRGREGKRKGEREGGRGREGGEGEGRERGRERGSEEGRKGGERSVHIEVAMDFS